MRHSTDASEWPNRSEEFQHDLCGLIDFALVLVVLRLAVEQQKKRWGGTKEPGLLTWLVRPLHGWQLSQHLHEDANGFFPDADYDIRSREKQQTQAIIRFGDKPFTPLALPPHVSRVWACVLAPAPGAARDPTLWLLGAL